MIQNKLLILAALLIAGAANAEPSSESLAWPGIALRREVWTLPKTVRPNDVSELVYGSTETGYFRLPLAPVRDGKVRSEIFPPGYRAAIEYRLLLKDGRQIALGKKQYKSPFASDIVALKPISEGQFTEPFFAGNAYTKTEPTLIPVVFNRHGEVVWAMRPVLSGTNMLGVHTRKLAADKYILFSQGANSGMQIVSAMSGKVEREVPAKNLAMHHPIAYDEDSGDVLTFAFECHTMGYLEDPSPVFKGLTNWINLLRLPRRTYMASKLMRINMYTGNNETLWRTHDSFSPHTSPNMALGEYRDRFLQVEGRGGYSKNLKRDAYRGTSGLPCMSDWTHENSVRHYPGKGYLMSQRNTNRIFLLDEEFKLKWTVGNETHDTYSISETENQLGMQHDPQFLEDGRILLFDNQVRWDGFKGGTRPNAIKILKLANGKATVDWKLDLPNPASEYRGSVERLSGDRLLAYQSGIDNSPADLYEIDIASKTVVAHLRLHYPSTDRPTEVRTISSIANETFIRPKPGRSLRPLAVHNLLPPVQDGAEFSNEGY